MMSTALCEAVRAGNVEVVKYLLSYHHKQSDNNNKGRVAVVIDPTIPSAYEDQTPLEIAMELKHNAMVDIILEALPLDTFAEESKYCQQVFVSVPTIRSDQSQYAATFAKEVLQLGHKVITASSGASLQLDDNNDSNSLTLQNSYRKETGNAKFWVVPSMEDIPSLIMSPPDSSKVKHTKIDSWFCFLLTAGPKPPRKITLLDIIKSEFIQPFSLLSNHECTTPNQIWLMVPSTFLATTSDKQQLIWFFQHYHSQMMTAKKTAPKINAMIVPCSWWNNVWRGLSPLWIETEVLVRLLKINEEGISFCGRIYDHKLERICWDETMPDPNPTDTNEWEMVLKS
mmetsp:Transcript_6831/g.12167  ORF Transcript_6831/g.12167 Transcript_6831/m.12167 type:complete len:341 (-) Transcript_6831:61-1083(-)